MESYHSVAAQSRTKSNISLRPASKSYLEEPEALKTYTFEGVDLRTLDLYELAKAHSQALFVRNDIASTAANFLIGLKTRLEERHPLCETVRLGERAVIVQRPE